jgi:methylated-DNA-protein-cysteine methyltransferase-like protein
VATYGQVAELAGMPRAARQVGWALHSLRDESEGVHEAVPWHRVLNARGEISRRGETSNEHLQRALLEAEGVSFGESGRVDWSRVAWQPRIRRTSTRKSK